MTEPRADPVLLGEPAELCQLGALILWRELRDVWGHVSCRLGEDGSFALATVRWRNAGFDEPVMVFGADGRPRDDGPVPVELPIHTEMYRNRPDVGAVVHAHPHAAVALSAAGATVRAITQQSVIFGDGVPLLPGHFVDSAELGAELAESMEGHGAALQRGHGAVCTGPTLAAAVTAMLYLEQTAQQLLWAGTAGGAAPLPGALRAHALHRRGVSDVLWRQLVDEVKRERWR
ncbi:MAG: class II aldolase/adducin family protein [Candidatus Dormibacteraeota bacterium]|nr:class II aldolase/adducin family protein [Candidatus Dormibacteraeota bacterium]MBV9525182.1 class II aldolase/adducin family protein [Candidatus Dormibacteraeota bacterium]